MKTAQVIIATVSVGGGMLVDATYLFFEDLNTAVILNRDEITSHTGREIEPLHENFGEKIPSFMNGAYQKVEVEDEIYYMVVDAIERRKKLLSKYWDILDQTKKFIPEKEDA
jgi:hypothetical protein